MRLIAKVNQVKPFSFQWLAARLERRTLPRSNGVVCITHYTQDAVASLAKRTWVVPNAVDQAFFDVRAPLSQDSIPEILCVGHICIRKNQNAFIKALDPFARERKFHVTFLGQSSPGHTYDEEFLGLVKERSWCTYGGMADRTKLRDYFRRANLLALPSLEDNCPMVVLEAMAAGVPVVAAKVGGVPDLISDRETGLFCDPLDPHSMRSAIHALIEDASLAGNLASRANAAARERFHPRAIASRHVEIYREILNASN